jgi:SAM-dependent methyltransferase
MNTSCILCNSNNLSFLRNYKNIHKSFDNLNLYKCNSCYFVFVNPMPNEKILKEFNESYFDSAHGGFNQSKIANAFFSGIAKIRYSYLQNYLFRNNVHNITNILEIGPGKGFFAENYLNFNPSHNYYVIESDKTCHNSLLNIGTNILDVDTYTNSNIQFDVVIISHVLEHVSDPIAFLKLMTIKLRVGGVLYLDVPCSDHLHKDLDEPHLLFFDKNPMIILFEKLYFNKIETNYFGQQINNLINRNKLYSLFQFFRFIFISKGFAFLFGKSNKDLKMLTNSLERAVMKPYKAHIESKTPAWWLRGIATKH